MQKLYAPPLPKHMMPTNNPFYSRKFVHREPTSREQKQSFKEWVSASGNRAIKRKLAERLKYLRFLAQNRNSFMNEVIAVDQDTNYINNNNNNINNNNFEASVQPFNAVSGSMGIRDIQNEYMYQKTMDQ